MKKLFVLFAVLTAITFDATAQFGNTLGAKIFINNKTPLKFLPSDEVLDTSFCKYYGDSILYQSVKGSFSYEAIVCLNSDCNKATIYIWNNDEVEVWERPITDSKKSITEFTCDNGKVNLNEKSHLMVDGQLKNSLLSKISTNLITADTEKIEINTQMQKKFMSLKKLMI